MTGRLMLLDTASLYFRAFHGVPDTVRSPDGSPVNAVRGLLDMIAKLVADFSPTSLVACWDDAWRPSWRVDLIPSYKEHRVARVVPGGLDVEEVPPLLTQQIPLIREVLEAFGIVVLGAPDMEADDVIGTLATHADGPVDVVTGDRDLFQLVDDQAPVRVIYTARGMSRLELVTADVLTTKYGITPSQYVDFAVMRGDPSDGLPGVAGIGEKTAATLLAEHGDLAGILAAAGASPSPLSASVRAKLTAAADYLVVAPRVVEVVRDLAVAVPPAAGPGAAATSPGAAAAHPAAAPDARLGALSPERLEAVHALAGKWGLGGSADRAIRALAAAG
ncbi:flap endonuclease [Subtercola sp. Z020]|uniref:5'-3' exonuclease n=1 Tax=Subtercola sp. Z020 TaxID=2080582 RepID=UPI000CE78DA9|nr:5'-3' exonuclease [Subtercola sp. Z020]PPF76568.1 flap endonuclease [Subtercola sp. Z020]